MNRPARDSNHYYSNMCHCVTSCLESVFGFGGQEFVRVVGVTHFRFSSELTNLLWPFCRMSIAKSCVYHFVVVSLLVKHSSFLSSASCILNDHDCYNAWTSISNQLRFETKGICSPILQNKVDYAYTICQMPSCREQTIPFTRLQFLKGWWSPTIGLSKTIGNDFDHPSPQSLVQVSLSDFNCSSRFSQTRLRIESYYSSSICSG